MNNNDFAVFILTNKRPNNVKTIPTLRCQGFTGRIVLVLDDLDPTVDEYKENYPDDEIYVFSKEEGMSITDSADNTNNHKAVVYARNMTFRIAEDLGIKNFLVLDDDYQRFDYLSDDKNIWYRGKIKNLDRIFEAFVEFQNNTNTETIAFLQGGDLIGGYHNQRFGMKITLIRKAMNAFFCKTDRPFKFYGLINEDVNMYVLNGSRGAVNFTSTHIRLDQTQTQANAGGLTTIYLELGTYVKSFYTLLYHPSSVRITEMGVTNKRLHHEVKTDFSYPKILSENFRKKSCKENSNAQQ